MNGQLTKQHRERHGDGGHLLTAGRHGNFQLLQTKEPVGKQAVSSSSSPGGASFFSQGEAWGEGSWGRPTAELWGRSPSTGRGIWSSGRKEGPLEGHKRG